MNSVCYGVECVKFYITYIDMLGYTRILETITTPETMSISIKPKSSLVRVCSASPQPLQTPHCAPREPPVCLLPKRWITFHF